MVYKVAKNSDILAHHGILGQKWGVRRYQNKDGSLTAAGKKRYSKELYSEMKKNEGKLYRSDYGDAVINRLSGDKRVTDYVTKNAEGYKKLFKEWSDASDKVDSEYENQDLYERAKKEAIKRGADPNLKYFDDAVFEIMANDKKLAELEAKQDEAWKKLNDYSKNAKPLVDDILGKYANMPANAINDHDVKAERWVYSALEDLMYRY